jgi:O-antigen ligase
LKKVNHLEVSRFRVAQMLLFVGPSVTLVVNPWNNYDPISLPKMFVLVCCAFTIFALLAVNRTDVSKTVPKKFLLSILVFFSCLVIAVLFSGAPFNQQLWGAFGRNTGFLTYASLSIILIALVWVGNDNFYSRMSWLFVLTSVPMTFYCLVQLTGNDPIPWSEFNTFGTLGNVNFLSAFLGMTSVGACAYVLDRKVKPVIRILLLALAIADLLIIFSTGSIQGPIIFFVGVGILILTYIVGMKRGRRISLSAFLFLVFATFYLLISALQNKGPLAAIVYQPSVIFRGDYIHAGWEMTIAKPIFGVGMDSYGDWYRFARGEISTLRTGPDRIANTAHNIFLDISSNGGMFLGLAYVAIVFLALFAGVRLLKTSIGATSYFRVIFAAWCAYQVQALVSINQIGVGIWGWIFTGSLIGMYAKREELVVPSNQRQYRNSRKQFRTASLPARHVLLTFAGFSVGFGLAVIPLANDIRYRDAASRGDIEQMIRVTSALGSTQFHRELALEFALRNNFTPEAKRVAEGLVADYPRNFFGWQVLALSGIATEDERTAALVRATELDPFNPRLRT